MRVRRLTRLRAVLRRRRWGLIALLALAGTAGSLAVGSAAVEVHVDGEAVALRTYAPTVADVVDRLEVEVGVADEVRPALDATVVDGMQISVVRAVAVDVRVDGTVVERVVAPVDTVGEVLAQAGLADVRALDAQVVPAWTAPVIDGSTIDVRVPSEVRVVADGEEQTLRTFEPTVERALAEAGVELGPDDEVSHDPSTPLDAVNAIVVRRVDTDRDVEEVTLPYEEVTERTTTLPEGERTVAQEGAEGLRRDVYEVTVVDGDVVERELVDQEIVREPEPRVVQVGIFQPQTSTDGMVAADDPVWDRLARCEAGGDWTRVSANGLYYGGLQFHPDTWRSVGGTGLPHEHSRETQIEMGRRLQARSGWGQWPHCSSVLELR